MAPERQARQRRAEMNHRAVAAGRYAGRGVLDKPDGGRKLHNRPTPLVGGIAVVVPFVCVDIWLAATTSDVLFFGVLAVAACAFLVIGFIDDRNHLPPVVRLLLGAAICYAVVEVVPEFGITFIYFSFWPEATALSGWTAAFTVLCLVGLKNAVNMADGRDGLVVGLSLVWVGLMAIHTPDHIEPLLAILAVTLLIVLAFNMAGRLFLGDSGSYAISIIIGLLAIHAYRTSPIALSADQVALWFLIPVVDCFRQMFGRMFGGRSPFRPDHNHLHHHLSSMMLWRWGLLVYLGMVAGPAMLAYAWPDFTALWMVLALGCYGMVLSFGMRRTNRRLQKLTST